LRKIQSTQFHHGSGEQLSKHFGHTGTAAFSMIELPIQFLGPEEFFVEFILATGQNQRWNMG
jgi:hypothetical protein